MQARPRSRTLAPVEKALGRALGWWIAPALLALSAGLVHYDLTHSNRPHELRFVHVVAVLAAAAVAVSASLLVRARRDLSGRAGSAAVRGWLALGTALFLGLLSLALFLATVAALAARG